MYEKLSVFEDRLKELEKDLSNVEIINDSKLYQQKAIEHAEIEPIVAKYREYKDTLNTLNENKELIKEKLDDEFKDLVREEINEGTKKIETLENDLKILLIPKDKNDSKNVISLTFWCLFRCIVVDLSQEIGGKPKISQEMFAYTEKSSYLCSVLKKKTIG